MKPYSWQRRLLDWFAFKFRNPYRLNHPSGYCPVQIEGVLPSGKHYYFRARGTQWYLKVADTDIGTLEPSAFSYGEREAYIWPAGGWISHAEAIRLATKGLQKYRESLK